MILRIILQIDQAMLLGKKGALGKGHLDITLMLVLRTDDV